MSILQTLCVRLSESMPWLVHPVRRNKVARRFMHALGPRFPICPLSGPLKGHKMRLDWEKWKSYAFGTWEPEVVRVIVHLVQHGWTVVDIGAHIGYYTLLFAKQVGPPGKVIAFEPLPENFQVLKENVALNAYHNVVLENKAVTDRFCRVSLARNDSDPLTSTASITARAGIEVEAVSLDDYFADRSERVAFVKVDVEGAEMAVLDGMRRILRKDRPLLLIELHAFDAYGANHPVLSKLGGAGYSLHYVDRPGAQVHILAEPR